MGKISIASSYTLAPGGPWEPGPPGPWVTTYFSWMVTGHISAGHPGRYPTLPDEPLGGTTKAEELMMNKIKATTMGRERKTTAVIVRNEVTEATAAVPMEERATLARTPSRPRLWVIETGWGGVKIRNIPSAKWAKLRMMRPKALTAGWNP